MNDQLKSVTTSLFFIVLGLGIGMLIFRKGDAVMVDAATYESAIQAITATITTDNDRFRINYRSLHGEVNGFYKSRSMPIFIAMDSIRSKRAVFNELVTALLYPWTPLPDDQQTKLFEDLINLSNQQDSVLLLQFKSMLQTDYKRFRIRQKNIDPLIAKAYKQYAKLAVHNDLTTISIANKPTDFKLRVLTAQMFRLQRLQFFEERFLSYVYTPCIFFERYFPILNPKQACLRAGEYFEAEIGIGQYQSSFDTSMVKLFVNGEQLPIDVDAGTALFRSKTVAPGSVELVLDCQFENPWTGKIWNSSSEFSYEVN